MDTFILQEVWCPTQMTLQALPWPSEYAAGGRSPPPPGPSLTLAIKLFVYIRNPHPHVSELLHSMSVLKAPLKEIYIVKFCEIVITES